MHQNSFPTSLHLITFDGQFDVGRAVTVGNLVGVVPLLAQLLADDAHGIVPVQRLVGEDL